MGYDVEKCREIGLEARQFHVDEYQRLLDEIESRRPDLDYHWRQVQNWSGFLQNLGGEAVSHTAEIIPFVPQQAPAPLAERHLTIIEGGLAE